MNRITVIFPTLRVFGWMSLASVLSLGAQESKPSVSASSRASVERLKSYVEFLASDELAGRNSGYEGNDKAAEYIAGQFKELGFQGTGEKRDAYLQEFEFPAGSKKLKTRNCFAYLEGADPVLKEEIVVIGAHHDHVGKEGQADAGRMRNRRAPEDKIWNGADDNASGTAVILELARLLKEGKVSTKRSILLMTFSAEEFGLLGSQNYCRHPAFPIKQHAAMINLDMVGRNPKSPLQVTGLGTSSAWKDKVDRAAKSAELEVKTSDEVTEDSDHASFAVSRIPVVHLFSGLHGDYHRQTDHADKLSYDRMAKVTEFALALLRDLADQPERIPFDGSFAQQMKSQKRLGIQGAPLNDEAAEALGLGEDEGGIAIEGVQDGSVGAEGGMQPGDVLVSFGGEPLAREEALSDLKKKITAAPMGEDIELGVLRNGERVTLKVRWEE